MIESTFYSYMSEVTYHKKDKAPSETINNIQKIKLLFDKDVWSSSAYNRSWPDQVKIKAGVFD